MNYSKYCTLYIVRHGQTDWNVKEITQGQSNGQKLTKEGIVQSEQLAKKLKGIKFEAIFSSDLFRAYRTAEIVALERKMAVQTSKLLRERAYGKFEGWKISERQKKLRKMLERENGLSKKERFKFKLHKEIESDEQMMGRFITFLRETAIAFAGKNVLIVSHGGMMRVFLIHLGFGEYEELPRGSVTNAACIKLLSDGVDFFVKEVEGVNKVI